GRVGEGSVIGIILLILSLIGGQYVAINPYTISIIAIVSPLNVNMLASAGFSASALPVWMLLAPRDYLSTFLKVGTIVGLAIGILIVAPDLQMPAVSKFIDGTGPVFSGNLFPFLFITIALVFHHATPILNYISSMFPSLNIPDNTILHAEMK
ncbi:carbon starvation CstA family protein, partial [Bacillus sp. D-CC]